MCIRSSRRTTARVPRVSMRHRGKSRENTSTPNNAGTLKASGCPAAIREGCRIDPLHQQARRKSAPILSANKKDRQIHLDTGSQSCLRRPEAHIVDSPGPGGSKGEGTTVLIRRRHKSGGEHRISRRACRGRQSPWSTETCVLPQRGSFFIQAKVPALSKARLWRLHVLAQGGALLLRAPDHGGEWSTTLRHTK